MKYYLSIDMGATSGRHVIGFEEGGAIKLREVHRFETGMDDSPNGLVQDMPRLLGEIKSGIKEAFEAYPRIESLSIDTWGVDYVLMDGDSEMSPLYSYRNERNAKYAETASKTLPFSELYRKTGIQFVPFNTIYQLYADLAEGRLERASDYLMLPNYFAYRLTGVKTHEMTAASSTARPRARSSPPKKPGSAASIDLRRFTGGAIGSTNRFGLGGVREISSWHAKIRLWHMPATQVFENMKKVAEGQNIVRRKHR